MFTSLLMMSAATDWHPWCRQNAQRASLGLLNRLLPLTMFLMDLKPAKVQQACRSRLDVSAAFVPACE